MRIPAQYLLILGIFFWSGNYVIGRALVGTIPPITLAYFRWLLGFIIFLPFCWGELKDNSRTIKNNFFFFILLGLTGVIGFNIFQYQAVKYTTAINATIINAATPMFTAIFSYLFLKNKLSPRQILGIGLGFFGVVGIITQGNLSHLLQTPFNIGDFLMLAAVLLNTVYLLILRVRGSLVPPKTLFITSTLGGLAVLAPMPVLENYVYGLSWMQKLDFSHLISFLYLGIFPTILSMLFFNKAIMEIGPVKTSIYLNLSIVFTSILGMAFLGERLSFSHLLGGSLIISGVWLTNNPQATAKKQLLLEEES